MLLSNISVSKILIFDYRGLHLPELLGKVGKEDYPTFLPSQVIMEQLLSSTSLVFPPCLFDGHGMVHICQWARDTLEYDGLCSHNPLSELPAGDHSLSAEELEA